MNDDRPIKLGLIDHRLYEGRAFGIYPADLARHMHVIGRSGSGKTTLLEGIAAQLIQRGEGVAVFDPHGDLIERLHASLPRARRNDVLLLDGVSESPQGYNLLDRREGHAPHLVVAGVISAFKKAYRDAWGPRLEHVFRNTLMAALEVRGATLETVYEILVDAEVREHLVARLRDPLARMFWQKEFAAWPKSFQAEALSPVQNKVAAALSAEPMRRILGARRSALRPGIFMDRRRILFARLSKGVLGEENASLLGALLLVGFQMAAYRRESTPPGARVPFTIIVDEFPAFATEAFTGLLAEARKFGLRLILAHQHLAQLDAGLREAVLGNVGTLVVYAVGPEDAVRLAPLFQPEFNTGHLQSLPGFHFAIRLSIHRQTSNAFTAYCAERTSRW